jgi:probable HAF family extracellular repeat protein
MKITGRSLALLASLLCATSLVAKAAPGYRLVPLDDGSAGTLVFGLNNLGEVVGMRRVGNETHAFRWRAGTFTDLHDAIDPTSTYTQATGTNDFSAIIGQNFKDSFEGFLLRGNEVSAITAVPGETQVFPFDINNRGQIITDAIVDGRQESYFVDGGNVQRLEGLPGSNDWFHALVINDLGVIAGNTSGPEGPRGVLWQDGSVMSLGVPPGAQSSGARALNNRSHVAGSLTIGGVRQAASWRDGTWTVLANLTPAQDQSEAADINNWGMIVGTVYDFDAAVISTPTLWFAGRAFDLNNLVSSDDPLKSFVRLEDPQRINDRGDVIVSGIDSRTQARVTYLLTLFGRR